MRLVKGTLSAAGVFLFGFVVSIAAQGTRQQEPGGAPVNAANGVGQRGSGLPGTL